MEINDIRDYEKLKLCPTKYFLLKSIVSRNEEEYIILKELVQDETVFKHYLDVLYLKKYIVIQFDKEIISFVDCIRQLKIIGFDNILGTKVSNELFNNIPKSISIDEFCSNMYSKFPDILIPTSKNKLRSGESNFTKKLKKFIKEFKYSQETIEIAIDLYIKEYTQKNWQWAQTADYFVFKDSNSKLEGYCELVKNHNKEELFNNISGQINLFNER